MQGSSLPTVLITGASSGIGATYADRFARRGHDLVLVARDTKRMEALAEKLRADYRVVVEVIGADLGRREQMKPVEERLRQDARIGILVNNAGANVGGGFANPDLDKLDDLLQLNVTAVMRLAGAIVPRLLEAGGGSIINVASVLAVAPEYMPGIYAGTKAFVLTFSQSLQSELGSRGLYVQAVMPAATRTEIWARSGRDPNDVPGLMEVGDLVDAALVGFDRKELVTIPPLPDEAQWQAFEAARLAMQPNFRNALPAARYRQ
jgi:uncharacterized protein